MKFYDFVIASAGCSRVSLVIGLAEANIRKYILLIDNKIYRILNKTRRFWICSSKYFLPFPVTFCQNVCFQTENYEKKEEICPFKNLGTKSTYFYKYGYKILQDFETIDIVADNKTGIFSTLNLYSTSPLIVFIKAVFDIYFPEKGLSKLYSPIFHLTR